MNDQIGEMPSLIDTLIELISFSIREENDRNVSSSRTPSHSDMATGAPGNSIPTSELPPPKGTLTAVQQPP